VPPATSDIRQHRARIPSPEPRNSAQNGHMPRSYQFLDERNGMIMRPERRWWRSDTQSPPDPPKSRVPAALRIAPSKTVFIRPSWQPPPSSLREQIPSNCASESFATLTIARHYHACPAVAQKAYRDEAGIGGACALELLDQAWRVETLANDKS
jgi:hypothetical protein